MKRSKRTEIPHHSCGCLVCTGGWLKLPASEQKSIALSIERQFGAKVAKEFLQAAKNGGWKSGQSCGWRPIGEYDTNRSFPHQVDLWLDVKASPISLGISDAWRVVDAYRNPNGKWCHIVDMRELELKPEYITHFMERPAGPNGNTRY